MVGGGDTYRSGRTVSVVTTLLQNHGCKPPEKHNRSYRMIEYQPDRSLSGWSLRGDACYPELDASLISWSGEQDCSTTLTARRSIGNLTVT